MKFITSIALLMASLAAPASGSKFLDQLASTPASQLQVLVSNLNVLIVSKDEVFKKYSFEDQDINMEFARVYLAPDNSLIFTMFLEAPASKISKSMCEEIIDKERPGVIGRRGTLPNLLRIVSPTEMSREDAKSLLSGAAVAITLAAAENKELSVSCGR